MGFAAVSGECPSVPPERTAPTGRVFFTPHRADPPPKSRQGARRRPQPAHVLPERGAPRERAAHFGPDLVSGAGPQKGESPSAHRAQDLRRLRVWCSTAELAARHRTGRRTRSRENNPLALRDHARRGPESPAQPPGPDAAATPAHGERGRTNVVRTLARKPTWRYRQCRYCPATA